MKDNKHKKVNQIPLDVRLKRLNDGYVSDSEYIFCLIQSMAETPIHVYLASFEDQRLRLRKLLGMTEEEDEALTYREAAARIHKMRLSPEKRQLADAAADILAAPLRKYFEERKDVHGKNTKDSP